MSISLLFFLVYDSSIQYNVNASKLCKNDHLTNDFIDFIGFYDIKSLAGQYMVIFYNLNCFIYVLTFVCAFLYWSDNFQIKLAVLSYQTLTFGDDQNIG